MEGGKLVMEPFEAISWGLTPKPNLPVKPATLFVAKAVLRDAKHENMTWGPAQLGVAAGITRAMLDGVLPTGAEESWLAIALVWVNWNSISSTIWSLPTVRLTGTSAVSGGLPPMKWYL